MAAIDLILSSDQPLPSGIGFAAASGGGYAAATYSYLVVARNCDSPYAGTADRDFLGLAVSPSLNHAVTLNQKVTLTWTAAKDAAGNVRIPKYYDIYQQVGASWTYGSAADLVGTVAGTVLTFVLTNGASLGTATIAAAGNSITIKPVLPLAPEPRANSGSGFNGFTYRASYAQDCLTRAVHMTVLQGSLTLANWQLLLKWAQKGIPVRLSDEDSTAYIHYYYGSIAGADYLASVYKDPRAQHTIELLVERETAY